MKKLIAVLAIILMAATALGTTVTPAPMPKLQFFSNTGAVLSGGKIYTYEPGSTTNKTTYTDSTGNTANTNPVVLDSAGRASIWIDGCVKFIVKTSADVTLYTTDNICEYQTGNVTVSQWQASGLTATYIGTTSFSVPGDQTLTFAAGTRLQTANTAGTIYSTVVSSSYGSGVTTVTVVSDSGSLDSGLSTVNIGFLTVTNPSLPINPVVTKTEGYTVTAADCGKTLIANLTSAGTFTLPAANAVPSGCNIVSKNTSTYTLTVAGTVDGASNPTIATQYDSMTLFSDGSAWSERRVKNATAAASATTATTASQVTDGTNIIHAKIIDIGDWNMDVTATIAIAHGLNINNIREVSATIRRDDGMYSYGLNSASDTALSGSISIDASNVNLTRSTGGAFDSALFDATSFNRGWVIITYIE